MSSKIPVSAILADFNRMLDEHWTYSPGGASAGDVDCSGAFVWSYKQHGHVIYHGSNRMARVEVEGLLPISEARPGMAAFKFRKPGEKQYDLPGSYSAGGSQYNGDLNDYYHVGLVAEDPHYVLNARSSADGFVSNKITENWDCVGYLKQVEYDSEVEVMQTAMITANSGSTVNMRKSPSKGAALVYRIPIGEVVIVENNNGVWAKIQYSKYTGYVLTEYLAFINDGAEMPEDSAVDVKLLDNLYAARDAINAAIKAAGGI